LDPATRDYIEALPLDPELIRAVRAAVSCTDSEPIPKVAQAGETVDGPEGRCQIMHNGVKVIEDCYYGRWMTELIRLLKGHHEPQEEKAFHEILDHVPANGTMVELGSFWAYYSLWFQLRIRGAKNYLIEPDPNNLEVGKRNFAINGATGQFFNYRIGSSSSDPEPFRCESDNEERLVPAISVDDFLSLVGLERVDVLFADIQGAELEMLEGAAKSMERGAIRFLFVSTHHHSISNDPLTHQKCLRFLAERHAHILAEHNVTESYTSDGLIAASLWPEDRQIAAIPVSRNHSSNTTYRELEYDLDEAWQALATAQQQLVRITDKCATLEQELEGLRRVPSFGDVASPSTVVRRLQSLLRSWRSRETRPNGPAAPWKRPPVSGSRIGARKQETMRFLKRLLDRVVQRLALRLSDSLDYPKIAKHVAAELDYKGIANNAGAATASPRKREDVPGQCHGGLGLPFPRRMKKAANFRA
jgi:FkbM family methyltransferase